MSKKLVIILSIILLSPVMGELLSGSAPPEEFFQPMSFIFTVLLYGFGTLLIREFRVRWNLHWSVIFLAIAYGIIEEAITTKAFFNIQWQDVGAYAHYGTQFGVIVPWSMVLLIFHSFFSTLIPILIIDLTWPDQKKEKLLGKFSLFFVFIGFLFSVLFGLRFMGTLTSNGMIPFYPEPILLIVSFVIIIFLVLFAYLFRKFKAPSSTFPLHSIFYGLFAFFYSFSFILAPHLLAEANIPLGVLNYYLLFVMLIGLGFSYIFICDKTNKERHKVSFVSGAILSLVVFSFLLTLNGITSMFVIGIIAFIILMTWRKRVLKK